ncbi:hexosyltransferase [Plakobranchus ocellatus]|uniref:Hexosyltransferase n=1 Tax=Plakobranchus ocellatus TaxID=259542 RepID=A0AAV4BD63_9GAST|nr:hexosyltransferase [Plakobranchus ocellatus]
MGILITFWKKPLFHIGHWNIWKQNVNLAICILSAQNHFEHREAIRSSWISDITQLEKEGKTVVAKFVIGREACLIHPENRLDPQDCKRWRPTLPENHSEVLAFTAAKILESTDKASLITRYLYVKDTWHALIRKDQCLRMTDTSTATAATGSAVTGSTATGSAATGSAAIGSAATGSVVTGPAVALQYQNQVTIFTNTTLTQ